MTTRTTAALALLATIAVLSGCGSAKTNSATVSPTPPTASTASARKAAAPVNVYSHTTSKDLSAATVGVPSRIYVPNSLSNTVDVIDPKTFKVIDHFAVGALPQHVTPSWDLKTLYVDNDNGNSLTPIDPRTGKPKGKPIPVNDPYNLYFTPDGKYAIVVAERLKRLDFRKPHSMKLVHSVSVPCNGVDHMDFTANGDIGLASCEFSGTMVKFSVKRQKVLGTVKLPHAGAMPQDVKLSPDGKVFYVADMMSNGIWVIDARSFKVKKLIATGKGAHGLYPSRDGRLLYISNRGEGTISVLRFSSGRLIKKWHLPGGGSPDMGGVSADGSTLWLSGRYNSVVYAINTRTGKLRAKIPVGNGPHGLSVWPQPGRYSLGHTGVMR